MDGQCEDPGTGTQYVQKDSSSISDSEAAEVAQLQVARDLDITPATTATQVTTTQLQAGRDLIITPSTMAPQVVIKALNLNVYMPSSTHISHGSGRLTGGVDVEGTASSTSRFSTDSQHSSTFRLVTGLD